MTDKELLELAAKAAGEPYYEHAPEGGLYLSNGADWNPLADDGDALRLAVKLHMSFVSGGHGFQGKTIWVRCGMIECTQYQKDDPYAATRRAIVRTAAEIGKSQ